MAYFGIKNLIQKSALTQFVFVLALAGCEDGLTLGGDPFDGVVTGPRTTTETIETDVVAPEAFSIQDTALWDGRPTFGGIWIAHPDAETPERVRISNVKTGKEIIGALYKRERDFPGPKIELSADAALALGVMAGTPTELSIVTLRRKTVEVEVEVEETETTMTTPLQRPVAEPKAPVVPIPDIPVVTPNVAANSVPEVEITTLPAIAAPASAVTPSAPDTDRTSVYIQVATMQSRSKAEAIIAKLERAGLYADIRERKTGTRTLYRVIVGPAASPEALEIMMGVVKEIGYKDAIILR